MSQIKVPSRNSLSYRQRLALAVGSASTLESRTSFPYGFAEYARVAARCAGKKLSANPLYLGVK